MITDKRIGVLMGGISSEREVSLRSGKAIYGALKEMGYDAVAIDVGKDVADAIKREKIEVAFIVLHGGWGENGAIQGLLEIMGIPYTGSGILASALAMNKITSRKIFEQQGLSVPPYIVLDKKDSRLKTQDSRLKTPLVIKPSSEGSSIGVSIVYKEKDIEEAIATAFRYGDSVIIEDFIEGKEIHVGVLGDRVLGAIEVRPKQGFYSYDAKYTQGLTDYIYPPELSDKEYDECLKAGLRAHISLGCDGATRVDLRLNKEGIPYVLEVNTLPGMTATSLLPKIAQGIGIGFNELVEKIMELALNKEGLMVKKV
jgi:D-alanine-D-alanine ligase